MGVHTGDAVIARVRWRATVNCVIMNQELIAKTPQTWESSELSVTVQSLKKNKTKKPQQFIGFQQVKKKIRMKMQQRQPWKPL